MIDHSTIDRIRQTQLEFQRAMGFPVDTISAKERNEVAEKYLFKLIEEVVELRKEFPSVMNPWSKTQKDEDLTRIKEELSDVILFILNFINIWRFSTDEVVEAIEQVQIGNFLHLKKKKLAILESEMQKVPDEAVMLGNGNITPRFVFVGQNPGQGLAKSCKMEISNGLDGHTAFDILFRNMSEEVRRASYFTNLVKVKTVGNTEPDMHITDFWFEFLYSELEILRYNNPGITVISLGNWTHDNLTTRLDSRWNVKKIYHPSYISRGAMSEEDYALQISETLGL